MEEMEEEWSRIGVVGRNIEELRLGVFDFGSLTVDMCVRSGGWVEVANLTMLLLATAS